MLDQGLFVTFNSDDPAYFGGYLRELPGRAAGRDSAAGNPQWGATASPAPS
jgi:hypothetical protein